MTQVPEVIPSKATRAFSLARIIDISLLAILMGFLTFIWFQERVVNFYGALALTIVFCLLAGIALTSAVLRIHNRRMQPVYRLARGLWLCDSMLTSARGRFETLCETLLQRHFDCSGHYPIMESEGAPVLAVALRKHSTCPANAHDVLNAADNARTLQAPKVYILCTGSFDEGAIALASRFEDISVILLDGTELARFCGSEQAPVSVEELRPWLAQARSLHRQWQRQRSPFRTKMPVRMCFAGILLLVTSLFTPFPQWYVGSAGVCFLIAAIAAIRQDRHKKAHH